MNSIEDGFLQDEKISRHSDIKQLFIKLKIANSHSHSVAIDSISSIQITSKFSIESINSFPYFLTSKTGIYNALLLNEE